MSSLPEPEPSDLASAIDSIDLEELAAAQLGPYLRRLLLCLKRYVARHGHRMLQANGTLSDLFVSFAEVRAVLGGPAVDGEGGVAERMGWPTEAEVAAELADFDAHMLEEAAGWSKLGRTEGLPVENLRQLFHLSQEQVQLLVATAAPLLSVDLSRLYAFAWSDFAVKRPPVGFLAELLADDLPDVRRIVDELRGDRPLVRYRLLELSDVPAWGSPTPLIHQQVHVPNRIVAYLQGSPEPLSVRIADTCHLVEPSVALPPERLILDGAIREELRVALTEAIGPGRGKPRLLMVGGEGVGRATALGTLLAPHGWGVLEVELDRLAQEREAFEDGLVEICREALLRRCLLFVRGRATLVDRTQLAELGRPLSRVLEPYEGPMAFSASQRVPAMHRYISDLFEVEVPIPGSAQQRELWQRAADEAGCRIESDVPALLTQRFNVTPGAIYRAVEEARGRAALFARAEGGVIRLRVTDLTQAVRRKTVHALGSIAEPFSTTLTWDDVVLPDDVVRVLKEILAHAKHREQVYDDWGFGRKVTYGRGLSCLFAGPPGTGKTMMAAVLAQTLGRELYRVDLSRIISKWVGETEKNLSLAFDEAERGQLVMLFDEADALFSKRTKTQSSNDRFANMEINYLLQRMEAYDGMTILTTNKEKAIDEAFKRRLKFKVTFPMPEAALRARLWKSMIPDTVPVDDDIPFDYLGQEFEMSGGNIKNAVIRAAFYAADERSPITSDLLYRAALQEAREMGMVVRDSSGDR